ncbi:MAG: T9SS type A sorting domain-containing protein, partial [Bacteroidales bacterium]|nr:T9SS type A sorting domain-containing protein [Bacteroidales bacterium]
ALKLVVYAKQFLYPGTTKPNCYRWPATTADSYAVGWYGSNSNATNKTNSDMKMGALLAIPPTTDITQLGLETEPGMQIAWTLQNYGGYIVDDTYAMGFCICAENSNVGSVAAQFQADYGYALEQKVNDNSAWVRDIQRLCVALRCVSNNGPTNIGGGPTTDTINRRQPMACAFGTPGSGITTCLPTGIIENAEESGIMIYPNPFTINFSLKISYKIKIKNAVMKIYDLCGKEVKTILINSYETNIERGEMESGIYFYSVINNNEKTANGKLVVQ